MTMGDRIKTWQQLLDERVDAAPAQTTNGDDRPDDNSRPHHVNPGGAEIRTTGDAARQELAQLRERMAVIKQETAVEVDSKWVSPWRTQETFDLKVKTRLTGHQEYRSLQDRVRDATARLPAEPNPATEAGAAS